MDEAFDYPLMAQALIMGQREKVYEFTQQALAAGIDPKSIIFKGLIPGMDVVGEKFRRNEYYVPQVLLSARAMYAGLDILKPLLTQTGVADYLGTVVIGTAQGDLHDIGKNLVAMMMEGAGFKVVNLGINVDAEKFIGAVKEHKPTLFGMSALLTTTMPYMGVVIKALKEAGLRDDLIVLVGGAPLNAAFAEEIEADAYCRDAAIAVETAKKLVALKRGG